jgi:hypothetical protein
VFTISQLVDELVDETKRPDMLTDLVRFVNQTVRESHFSGDRRAALLFKGNFKELELTATSETGFSWDAPTPAIFQHMAAVQYPEVFDFEGKTIWAMEIQPGKRVNDLEHYYYRAGDSFAFSGYGGNGKTINIGYYEFPPSLKYYPDDATRPAEYDPEDGWTYPAGAATPEEQEAARLRVTNWLLLRWSDVISEGVRAKLYKRLSDTERARTSYSMYESLRQGLWTSETMVTYQG